MANDITSANTLTDFRLNFNTLNGQVTVAEANIATLFTNHNTQNTQLAGINTAIATINSSIATITTNLSNNAAALTANAASLVAAHANITTIHTAIGFVNTAASANAAVLVNAVANIASINTAIGTINTTISTITTNLSNNASALTANAATLVSAVANIASINTAIAAINVSIANIDAFSNSLSAGFADGSAANAGIRFSSNNNVGIFRVGTGGATTAMGITVGGVERMRFNTGAAGEIIIGSTTPDSALTGTSSVTIAVPTVAQANVIFSTSVHANTIVTLKKGTAQTNVLTSDASNTVTVGSAFANVNIVAGGTVIVRTKSDRVAIGSTDEFNTLTVAGSVGGEVFTVGDGTTSGRGVGFNARHTGSAWRARGNTDGWVVAQGTNSLVISRLTGQSAANTDYTTQTTYGTWAANGLTVVGNVTASGGLYGANLTTTGIATIGGELVVTGNLTVNGTTTTVNTQELNVSDSIIRVNSDYTGASPTENGGLEVERGTQPNVGIIWNETTDTWTFTNDGTAYSNIFGVHNDGAGSGLDADLLDGLQGSAYATLASSPSFTGSVSAAGDLITSNATAAIVRMHHSGGGVDSKYSRMVTAGGSVYFDLVNDAYNATNVWLSVGRTGLAIGSIAFTGTGMTMNGSTVWHSGNDGAGSGLDADLLDGQNSTYYVDIPARLGYTPANLAGATFTGQVNVGANVRISTATIQVGNATVNTSIGANVITLNGSNVWTTATLTNLNQLTNGPGYRVASDVLYVGTTSISLSRGTGAQTLTGVSIDGSAASATTATTASAAPWSGITGKPTTLAGYGITDAAAINQTFYIGTTAITANRASAAQSLTGITSIDGNAASATVLQTARTIAGVSFNGSANISIPFANLSSLPTTLAGYGITNGAALTGATFTGAVNVNGARTQLAANSEAYALFLRYNTATNGVYLGSPGADTFGIYNTAGTQLFRLDSTGAVNWNNDVWHNSRGDTKNRFYFATNALTYIKGGAAASGTNEIVRIRGSDDVDKWLFRGGGDFFAAGNITAYWSDRRLKKNVTKLRDWRKVMASISGYSFEWNEKGLKVLGQDKTGVDVGFIAQEVKAAVPQAAAIQELQYKTELDGTKVPIEGIGHDPNDPFLTVKPEKLAPYHHEAIKGLMAENDDLKAKNLDLEDRLNKLEALVASLIPGAGGNNV